MGPQFKFKTYQAPKTTGDELPLVQTQQASLAHHNVLFDQSAELSVTLMTMQRNLLLDLPDTSQLQFHSLNIPHSLEDGEHLMKLFELLIFCRKGGYL